MTDDTVTRAIRSYFRRFGKHADQPSRALSEVDGEHVVLQNGYRELARYRITPRGLRFVE